MSESLLPHELQCARLPCPSLSPGVCSNSCWLSQWCYTTIWNPWTVAHQAPLSMGFSSKNTGVGSHRFSRGSFWYRVSPRLTCWTQVSHTAGGFITVWATREAPICFTPIRNTLTDTSRFNVWLNIWAPHVLVKLTHKINPPNYEQNWL